MIRQRGFTVIEVLFCVLVLMVLLALLTPALDRMIYRAELAACEMHLSQIGMAVGAYAGVFDGRYPYRELAFERDRPDRLTDPSATPPINDRDAISMIDMALLNDPLCERIGYRSSDIGSDTSVYGDYALWFSFQHRGERGLFALDKRMTWKGRRFDVVASDLDAYDEDGHRSESSHPDESGVMSSFALDNASDDSSNGNVFDSDTPDGAGAIEPKYSLSRWRSYDGYDAVRGKLDLHYLLVDGTVERYEGVTVADERMAEVAARGDLAGSFVMQLPR